MQRVRYFVLGILVAATVGSLAGTLGYAWYLRSDRYRQSCAAYLEEALGLPSDIGRVVPRSWTAREFDDVEVWLPGRRSKALSCRRSLVRYTPTPDKPEAYEIEMLGGTCEISTRTWLREDYRLMIESGLRPGFDPEGPQRVHFADMDLRFERGEFRGWLEGAAGVIVFETLESARAAITCRALNGHVPEQPVQLNAQFSPRADGVRIDGLTLTVPSLPLVVMDLQTLAGVDVWSGAFSGRLDYQEDNGTRVLAVSGTCLDINLAECTEGLTPKPWSGCCPELELTNLLLENGRPQRLRFRGVLTGLVLGDVLTPWELEGVGGKLILRVRDADLSTAGIDHLVASGECTDLSLTKLTEHFELGVMSGTARLVIDDLTVENNRLCSLDAEIRVDETDEVQWIEGRLVTALIGRVLNMQIPPILPERIEYTQLGLRLEIRDEWLYVFGTHGARDKTILTVRMLGQEVPLVNEPENAFDLRGWCDQARAQAAAYLQRRLDSQAPPAVEAGVQTP